MSFRTIQTRFDVLRGGVNICQLQPIGNPIISCDASAEIKLSLSGSFIVPDAADLITDRIRPVLIVDGIEHNMGIFNVTTAGLSVSDSGLRSTNIEGYDNGLLLRRYTILSRQDAYIPAGTRYDAAINALCVSAGITTLHMDATDAVISAAREDWEVGDNLLTVVNDLLSEINYRPIWFDRTGAAHAERYVRIGDRTPDRIYKADRESIIKRGYTKETDVWSNYNVFTAVVSSADLDTPLVATASNTNESSKLSVQNRGRVPSPVVRLKNIAGQVELQQYVNNLLYKSMMTNETVTVETALAPDHEVYDAVQLSGTEIDGLYEEIGWEMELGYNGTMTHTLRREVLI